MSTVAHDTAIANSTVADETLNGIAEGSPSVSADNVLSGATDSEQKKIDEYRASEARVVDLAEATLDPKDMLKKYARLGGEAFKLAQKRKASLAAGAWNGKDDLNKVCSDLETLVKMRVAVKDVRMLVYIRVHLWLEAVKVLVPNAEKLSYHLVVNKLLPSLQFDPADLTGEIKKDWLTWVRTTVERQLGDAPMSFKELDASIVDHKTGIERDRNAKKDPEKVLLQEQKAAESKVRKDRRDAQSKISESLDKAIVDGHAEVNDVVAIVDSVLRDHNLSLPKKLVGFDPVTCTAADCKTLASTMLGVGKLAEMKILRDSLDVMLKIAEHNLATASQKTA